MACHNSKCLLWVPNNVPLIVICVCEDELYTLYENLHYHLDEFVTLIWYMAVTLILSYVLIIETDFDSHTLRASYLSERLQPPGFESEICFGLWHSSLPFYCLSTVNVSWAGLWEAVHNGPRHPKCLYGRRHALLYFSWKSLKLNLKIFAWFLLPGCLNSSIWQVSKA